MFKKIKKSAKKRWGNFKDDIGGEIGFAVGLVASVVLVSTVVSPLFFILIGMAAMIGGAYAGEKIAETFKKRRNIRIAKKAAVASAPQNVSAEKSVTEATILQKRNSMLRC